MEKKNARLLDAKKTAKIFAELLSAKNDDINLGIVAMVNEIGEGATMKRALLAITGGLKKIQLYDDEILSESSILLDQDVDGILVDNTDNITAMKAAAIAEISQIVAWLSLFVQSFCEAIDSNFIQVDDQERSSIRLKKCLGLEYPKIILTEHIHASARNFASPENLMKQAKENNSGYYGIINLFLAAIEKTLKFCHDLLLDGDPKKKKYKRLSNVCYAVRSSCSFELRNYWENKGLVCDAAREVSKDKVLVMLSEVLDKMDAPAESLFEKNGTVIDSDFWNILQGLRSGFVKPLFVFPRSIKDNFQKRDFYPSDEKLAMSFLTRIRSKLKGKNFNQYERVYSMMYQFTQSQ